MSDASVAAALRSDAGLVVVEAPAGCGKTYQAASYAGDHATGLGRGRMLILTHTHAACDVIARRASQARAVIRTIDSLLVEVGTAYHRVIDLPLDVSGWARQNENGYDEVGSRVAALMTRIPRIAAALATRYPIVLCDEHQDSNPHQHRVVMTLREAGASLRVFGDPMQSIYGRKDAFEAAIKQWNELCQSADAVERLDVGHRWKDKAPELGEWINATRLTLQKGEPIDLRGKLPKGLSIFRADNRAFGYGSYRIDQKERKDIDAFVESNASLLVLAAQNNTVGCLRGVFNRRMPIWEGHTRNALDELVREVTNHEGKPVDLARSVAGFMSEVTVGFTETEYAQPFVQEVVSGCVKARHGKPGVLQEVARTLLASPNHKGVAVVLRQIEELAAKDDRFSGIKIDHPKEYHEAIQLADFSDMNSGHTEVTRRRAFVRPTPANKSISTIHKAKGLECERVLVMPCDKAHFGGKAQHRCLLYVALSRPVRRLGLVIPKDIPSPLFVL